MNQNKEQFSECVRVWEEPVMIPTYEAGEAEKLPVFLNKRVYQGSSGKVYPYPVTETISDTRKDKEYRAVYLENEYLKIMILPELGGRIQRAYDKTNGYDFVYYNHVIKPALVGLTGPWISGGSEFNWPQHHRPTTFLPTDYELETHEDGSCSVLIHDVDQMYGTKGIAKFTLYPGKAYLEIRGQLYNRTPLPQTFLWWANPAVAVNDQTQSIFPPDVHAVMDHGKRDVSRFPIATGVYYKHDYSEGVDISRYKNIPVPTSYMAEKSKYDFVGGYDYGKKAGILHVADHHISPGKKQWTWGCGDFGTAWDRNLTDEDGPYIELMTGVFTDNQPDFTWLKPFEEKTFCQYFMPYKEVGQVKNATREAAIHLSCSNQKAKVIAYATSRQEHARIRLTAGERVLLDQETLLSPVDVFETEVPCGNVREEELKLTVSAQNGRILVSWQPETEKIAKLPEPAKAAKDPAEILTNEELYLTGLHIEQYRHATFLPDPYYLEGLKRDPGDVRINTAYAQLLMRRGRYAQAEKYLRTALKRLTERNPNPYTSEPYYLLGLDLLYLKRDDEAYDAFYKAAWSNEQQEMSFYYLAVIDARRQEYELALEHAEQSLVKNAHNIKARGLKAWLLGKLGRTKAAAAWIEANLALDPFDFVSGFEQVRAANVQAANAQKANVQAISDGHAIADCGTKSAEDEAVSQRLNEWNHRLRGFRENYLMTARDYAEFGAYDEALAVLHQSKEEYPLLAYYQAYYEAQKAENRSCVGRKTGPIAENAAEAAVSAVVSESLRLAESYPYDYCFPNKPEDIAVLSFAVEHGCTARAPYYLGNLYYDRQQWEEADRLWSLCEQADPDFAPVRRNRALLLYNRRGEKEQARAELEKAAELEPQNVRLFLELDQLYKKLGMSFEERLARCEAKRDLVEKRDDLYIEYITLVNLCGGYQKAYDCIMGHRFHPWEGGEGKITAQYTLSLLGLARNAMAARDFKKAEELLRQALVYPENLGEGKLEGTKDNHIYYHLGLALEAQGREQEAMEMYRLATIGTDEPAGAMYYNDQPADMILYQGLAWQKLKESAKAKSRFYRLIDYGEQHLEDDVRIEYFAVSLPDFLIFEDDMNRKNRAHCCYLMALGNLGLGNREKAREFLKQASVWEPWHMMSRVYGDWSVKV